MGKSFAFNSFWSVATQIGVLFGGVISSVILNRYLKPEGRGEVALVTFWPTIVALDSVAGWIPGDRRACEPQAGRQSTSLGRMGPGRLSHWRCR